MTLISGTSKFVLLILLSIALVACGEVQDYSSSSESSSTSSLEISHTSEDVISSSELISSSESIAIPSNYIEDERGHGNFYRK